jgi:hypothetical protein
MRWCLVSSPALDRRCRVLRDARCAGSGVRANAISRTIIDAIFCPPATGCQRRALPRVGAGEQRSVAFVIAAHLHAAMPAGIEKDVDLLLLVAAQDHRLAGDARGEIVARIGDPAVMPNKQPGRANSFSCSSAKRESLTKISRLTIPRSVSTRRSLGFIGGFPRRALRCPGRKVG